MSRKSFIHNTRRQHAQSLAILAGLAAGALGLVAPTLQAANLAADNASNYVPGGTLPYSFQQVNGSGSGPVVNTSEPNEGYGFGPWTIIDNTAPGVAMHLSVSSNSSYGTVVQTTVGTTASSPNTDSTFTVGGYGSNATQASQVDIYRPFTGGTLIAGQKFSFAMGGYNGGSLNSVVSSGNYSNGYPEVGFSMETAAPVLSAGTAGGFGAPSINDASSAVQAYINNLSPDGSTEIVVTDANGTTHITDAPTLPGGSVFSFTVGVGNTYTLAVTAPGGGSPLATYTGTYTGDIVGANIFSQNGHDLYFNSLAITSVPDPATMSLFAMAGIGGLLLIRRRKVVWRR